MADQNLTEVTAIIAGVFLLIQVVIFMICLSRVSEVKQEDASAKVEIVFVRQRGKSFRSGPVCGIGGDSAFADLTPRSRCKTGCLNWGLHLNLIWYPVRCGPEDLYRSGLSATTC